MKLNLSVLILLAVLGSEAVAQESEFATGRAYYMEGEFKKAVAHFQMALKVNPNDAEAYYWMGMSYEVLADIAVPFAGKYTSKARVCLTRATELAPSRLDYRRELFDFLVDSASSARGALRHAADLMRTVPTATCTGSSSSRQRKTPRWTLDLADYSSPFPERPTRSRNCPHPHCRAGAPQGSNIYTAITACRLLAGNGPQELVCASALAHCVLQIS